MGSLVPGWDSNPTVGKEWIDDGEEQEEIKGYFAKLAASRRRSGDLRARSMSPVLREPDVTGDQRLPILRSSTMERKTSLTRTLQTDSIRAASPGSARSAKASTSPRRTSSLTTGDQDLKWWKKFSSAALNEMEEEQSVQAAANQKSTFVPQYNVTGQQVNYILHTDPPGDNDNDNPIVPGVTAEIIPTTRVTPDMAASTH